LRGKNETVKSLKFSASTALEWEFSSDFSYLNLTIYKKKSKAWHGKGGGRGF
jgi:hypothetical protein